MPSREKPFKYTAEDNAEHVTANDAGGSSQEEL